MKKLIFIPFLFFYLILSGQDVFWVTPRGDDDNAGTDSSSTGAWKNWARAFNGVEVDPSDTVYFRGGIYEKNLADGPDSWFYNNSRTTGGGGWQITRDGTVGNYIHYWAYPPDVAAGNPPILDCLDAYTPTNRLHSGIRTTGVNYVHFKGLITQNVNQPPGFGDGSGIGDAEANGWQFGGSNCIFENCIFRYIWGHAMEITSGSSSPGYIYFRNCDAHNCVDSLSTYQPGNDGTGFTINGGGRTYFYHCRAWLCGDQGFTGFTYSSGDASQYAVFDGCWSFRNGCLEGSGYGWKMCSLAYTDGNIKRTFINNLTAFNRVCGFVTFDYTRSNYPYAMYGDVFNNTAYHNGHQGWSGGVVPGYGFVIHNTGDTDANELKRVYRNNLAFDNETGAIQVAVNALYTHSYNSWDNPPGITVATSDFLSLDSTGISSVRQADGSLPDLNGFLHLSSTSQAKWAGTDVGLTHDADSVAWHNPPSMGFKEWYIQEDPEEPLVLSDLTTKTPYWQTETTATSGGNVYDDGGGTVSARGVCWNTTGLPTIADDKTEDGTGTGEFWSQMTVLSREVVYYVRAYATNEAGTAYGNQMTFRTSQVLVIDGKPLVVDGKVLIVP